MILQLFMRSDRQQVGLHVIIGIIPKIAKLSVEILP